LVVNLCCGFLNTFSCGHELNGAGRTHIFLSLSGMLQTSNEHNLKCQMTQQDKY
jgi:hypothetical protein